MADILNEISRFVEPKPTTGQFVKKIDRILTQLDGIDDYVQKNIEDKSTRDIILKHSQAMRSSSITSLEVFQDYVDKSIKDM
jgi:hypothetical protein